MTPKQKDILKALEAELSVDKLTISFSMEGRTESGQKRSAFVGATIVKRDGRSVGWTPQEMHVVTCLMSKHVVMATFRDARARHIVSATEVKELSDIFTSYDQHLVKLLQKVGV